jgi:catechol 2,3-dioxygenase-like lactoylglutathione lyase family enzyme
MRLDHIAYRVKDRQLAADFFFTTLGYTKSAEIPEGFDIQFEDGTFAKCLVLEPPETNFTTVTGSGRILEDLTYGEFHSAPEIFVSDGSENSVVYNWVENHGPGIHHLAYEVGSVSEMMKCWQGKGIQFTTSEPLSCPGLVQAFTVPDPITGIIYEIIERESQGFCKENVKDLMESTNGY